MSTTKPARTDRSHIAYLLCAGLLVNALVCSFNHATHVGLGLLLGKGAFCLADNPTGTDDPPPAALLTAAPDLPINCPLCHPVTLNIALLLCLGWLLLRGCIGTVRLPPERRAKSPPRYAWPSLNPRASPALSI